MSSLDLGSLTAHLDEVVLGSGFSKNATTLFLSSSSKIPDRFVSEIKCYIN